MDAAVGAVVVVVVVVVAMAMRVIDEGYCLYRRGAYEEALRCLSEAATAAAAAAAATCMSPDDPEPHRLKGMALYRLGRYGDSLESLDAAVCAAGAMRRISINEAQALRHAGRRQDAGGPESDAQAGFGCQLSRALYLRAKARFRIGRTGGASSDLNANLRLSPGHGKVLELILQEACGREDDARGQQQILARAVLPAGLPFCGRTAACAPSHEIMLKGVLDAAEVGARLLPSDSLARAAMAHALSLLSMPERALDEIDAAISLDPDVAGHHATRSGILCDLGRMRECEGSADDALALDPEHPQAVAWKGLCLYVGGFHGDGRDSVKSAYRRAPDDPTACLCMAYVLGCEGKSPDALGVCVEAFRMFPHDGRLRLLLGALLDEDADCR